MRAEGAKIPEAGAGANMKQEFVFEVIVVEDFWALPFQNYSSHRENGILNKILLFGCLDINKSYF